MWALPAALCLALALALAPSCHPLPAAARNVSGCRRHSRALLAALGDSLRQLQVFNTLGFECTLEEVDLEDITASQVNTLGACTSREPGAGSCPVLERDTFDTSKCLRGIYDDLKAYRAELKDFNDPKVLTAIDELMKALRLGGPGAPQPSSRAAPTFRERMRLCRVLHAFRIRAVTISRMLDYVAAAQRPL
ncbi:interleukin-12 subunit alpha [Eudromia elegans]